MQLTQTEVEVLRTLDLNAGLTTPRIGKGVTYCAHNKRQQSAALRYVLLRMEEKGLVRRLDELKPVCWCLTVEGKSVSQSQNQGA